jgi:hypothetical protein
MFYFVFGWLMGRNIRATRQAAYNAALPESVKEQRYAQQQAAAQARIAAKAAKRQHRREFYKAHPWARFFEVAVLVIGVGAYLIYAFAISSSDTQSTSSTAVSETPTTTASCGPGAVRIDSAFGRFYENPRAVMRSARCPALNEAPPTNTPNCAPTEISSSMCTAPALSCIAGSRCRGRTG